MLKVKFSLLFFSALLIILASHTFSKNKDIHSTDFQEEKKSSSQTSLYPVVSVADGDTLSIMDEAGKRRTLRLLGIDAPEMSRPSKKAECFAEESRSFLKSIAEGKVSFLYDPQKPRQDVYGRELVYVYTEDGVLLNQKLIEEGFAFEYFYKKEPYLHRTLFLNAQKEAQKLQKGLWSPQTCSGKKF